MDKEIRPKMKAALAQQNYIGIKVVNAMPMTRGEYNALRGWDVPKDENPGDDGYLVEYTDGGKSNHPDFAGYISWSPQEVFDNAYRLRGDAEGMPLRMLDEHRVNPANDRLMIGVMDTPGHGNAHHYYEVQGFDDGVSLIIVFQNGPIHEVGVNGMTHEVLLAILADRLRSFQAGPYACKENACALTHIEEAQHWLQARTLARMRRGVEGTHNI